MEDEKIQKLNYINENIIEKGYNPEELSNFIIKKTGIPMDNINFERLKEMIEQFKDQGLQDTYQNVKIKEDIKRKEESPFDSLYSNQSYDVKTSLQQKNKLLEFEEQKKVLEITISEPKKEKSGGFFSKAVYSYRVITPLISKDVRRTYNDFEWFRNELLVRYPLRLVPPCVKENSFYQLEIVDKNDTEEILEEKKIKYLSIFMSKLLQRKIFRTSPILYEFLELDEKGFKKYKDILAKNKYELSIKLDNLKTMHDKVHCELKKDDIKVADNFNKKYTKLSEIYQKLIKGITNIVNDFKLLQNHMKDISDQFAQLNTELSENKSATKIKGFLLELNKIFNQWSISYGNQSNFFKDDFKPVFTYMDLEGQEMSHIYKNYVTFKNEYEDFTYRINKKKEELFEQKDYSKWSLAPGTESQLPMFQNNKKIAFEKMLYRETILLSEEKKRIACTIHYLFKQFDKMIMHQSNNLENYLNNLKKNNQLVIGDAYNLIKLFSIIKQEENIEKNEAKNIEKNEEKKEEQKEEEKKEEKSEIKE